MTFYPPKISERLSTTNCSRADDANAAGIGASFECGSFVRISLRIDDDSSVASAVFRTNGCGYMIAAADVLTDILRGRELTELGGLETEATITEIENRLEEFPGTRKHCVEAVVDASKAALANHRSRRVEEFQGEKALICTCFGVSEETIANLIAENDLMEVAEVAALCRAGSGCGACRMLIREMLDAARPGPCAGRFE